MMSGGATTNDHAEAEAAAPSSSPSLDPVNVAMLRIALEHGGWSVADRGDHLELIPTQGTVWRHAHPVLDVRPVGRWAWWGWRGGPVICRANYLDRAPRLILSTLRKHM